MASGAIAQDATVVETLPYVESFESGECQWTLIDNNTDPNSFKMQFNVLGEEPFHGITYLVSGPSTIESRNAWAFSVPVRLEAGTEYYASTWFFGAGVLSTCDEFEITYGTEANEAAQTNAIMDYTGDKAIQAFEWTKVENTFQVPESGEYVFAIHHCTQATSVSGVGFDRFYIGTTPDSYTDDPQVLPEPEGEKVAYSSTHTNVSGEEHETLAYIVYGENNTVYVKGLAPDMPEAWVQGVDRGSEIAFPTEQYLGKYDNLGSVYDLWMMAGTNLHQETQEIDGVEYPRNVYTAAAEFVLLKEGDRLVAKDDNYVIEQNGEGGFIMNGYGNMSLSPLEYPIITPTEKGDTYSIRYDSSNGAANTTGYVYTANDSIYIQGLCPNLPTAWVYGTVKDGVATFPGGQCIGTYILGEPVYFWGCQVTEGAEADEVQLTGDYTMQVDGEQITGNGQFAFAYGNTDVIWGESLSMEKIEVTMGKPAPATSINFTDGAYANIFILYDAQDIEGNPLLKENLYFRIYLDDIIYTFDPSQYKDCDEPMTDIPVTFEGWDFMPGNGSMTIFMYESLINTIGVEMVYKMDGQETVSDRAYWTVDEGFIGTTGGSSISNTAAGKTVKEVTTVNMAGQVVPADTKGLVLQVITYDDGTRETVKKWNR